jgi:secondary thiamine-phosphate synthase enzyme
MVVTKKIRVKTQGDCDIVDITDAVQRELSSTPLKAGIVTVFMAHTTAGLTIIESEGGLLEDFKNVWENIAPQHSAYQHNIRAHDDNAHSHLRASILGPSLVVPFAEKRLTLGVWQRLVMMDFDSRPRHRDLVLQFLGE